MVFATIASVLAVLLIIGLLVWAVLNSRAATERANARLMTQQSLLTELEAQGDRLEGQADVIRRLNELLVDMGEDQIELLTKVDRQTETIETLVTEVETLQRETIVRVTELEVVEVPGEPGRFETRIVTETDVVEVPGDPVIVEVPAEPEPEPEPDVPGRACSEMPPTANRQHCR